MVQKDHLDEVRFEQNSNPKQIEVRLKDSPRDIWDKLGAIAPLISGFLVGCIGLYATTVYDARQKEAESARKERELVVTQVQTLEKFIPHLSSGDERRKEVAILGMAALGNQELAEKVALLYQGSGSAKALATFARSEDSKIADRARQALANLGTSIDKDSAAAARSELATLLSDLSENVVRIDVGGILGTGFLVGGNDTVITVAHLFHEPTVESEVTITSPSGASTKATLVKLDKDADVAILKLQTKTTAKGIRFTGAPSIGEPVVILGITGGGWKSTSGRITDIDAKIGLFPGKQLFADLDSEGGFSGAPVVNHGGHLIGMLHAADRKGLSILVPASRIVPVLSEVDDGVNKHLQPLQQTGTSAGG